MRLLFTTRPLDPSGLMPLGPRGGRPAGTAYGARPVRFTVLGLLEAPGALIVSVPVIGLPAAVGWNVTTIWHVPPGATVDEQVLMLAL